MFSVANSTDSSGAFIFGGYHTNTQPFEKDNDSNIVYKGDRGTNAVAVSETRTIGTTLDGGSVFMAVKSGNSVAPMFTILPVNNPSDLPDPSYLDRVEEPFIKATIITKSDYVGNVMSLCIEKRGTITNQTYLTTERVELSFDLPLAEIVFDFYDRLKTVSKGYASFDYSPIGMRPSKLVKVDILLNGNQVDALSALIHADNAYNIGKKMCEKLRGLIPRQQFDIPVQAAIGAKIISRETIKALRKDVTAKCYGGDITRKRKLLEKQKKGKKKMRQVGNVEIPQQAFMAVLQLND